MNNPSKFDRLTFAARYIMRTALDTLTSEKSGMQQLTLNPATAANTLTWNAEAWMRASYELQYGQWAAEALEAALLECWEAVMSDPASDSSEEMDEEFNAMLDERAAAIITRLAKEAMRVIYDGPDTSSNPLRAIDSGAKGRAARTVMEGMCNLSSFRVTCEGVDDLLNGEARREEEREEQRYNTPSKIEYWKHDGMYCMAVLNSNGDCLDQQQLEVSRKGDALTAIADHIRALRQKAGANILINVEAK